jgi:microcystin-dependent protein
MKDARISQLNAAGALSGGEYIPITQLNSATNVLRTVYTNPDAFKEFVFGAVADSFCPTGSIVSYAGNLSAVDLPNGWLLCDGRSVLRSTYIKLYDRIGTTYGSTNDLSFNLPSLRGRVVMGYCDTAASTSLTSVSGGNWDSFSTVSLGSVGGEFNHQLIASELPLQQTPVSVGAAAPVAKTLYNRQETSNARTSWTDTISNATIKSIYNGLVPNILNVSYSFGQCEAAITDAGSWVSLGSTGNNSSRSGSINVRPDSNGNISVRVTDRGWGGHGLKITANVPGATTLIAEEAGPSSSVPFNVTQPYIVMNYIIKY